MGKDNAEILKECITYFGELSSGETNQAVKGAIAEKESIFALIDSLVVEWQPIETDLRPSEDFDYDFPEKLYFEESLGIKKARCVSWSDEEGQTFYQYVYDGEGNEITPTHWQPLPAPPTK